MSHQEIFFSENVVRMISCVFACDVFLATIFLMNICTLIAIC
jgi:hypothetical protein